MNIIYAYYTDKGPIKEINQDSLGILSAEFNGYTFTMAVICDGLGGLSEGEKASACVVKGLSLWFENVLPELLEKEYKILDIRKELDSELHRLNKNINKYTRMSGNAIGTTMTTLLIISSSDKAISAHIGDSRLYRIYEDQTVISTNDHSVIAEEIRNGNITESEASDDPRQNQLTKCIGAGLEGISFDYSIIPVEHECTYLLCSDGFRKKITTDEISSALRPSVIKKQNETEQILRKLTNLCIDRGETDNITSLIIKICPEEEKKLAE